MKRILMLLLTLLLCLGTFACGEETDPALTLMVYLCGSDLESSAGAATADLEEMMAHCPADGSVRVIVMASGAQKWHNGISAGETAIYELTGAGLDKVHTLPLQSMGEAATLTALLDYGYANAPAARHALILWDHGAGPLLGVCFDEQFKQGKSMDGLTLEELGAALAASPAAADKLSWIGFDACLMASVETACMVAPYAEYMIASQDTEPASGWAYTFLAEAGHDADGAETGRRIVDAYFASLGGNLAPATLSCVALENITTLGREMDALFNALHLTLDDRSYPDFAACRVNTKSVGCATTYEYDLVDLVDLLEVYQAEGMAECDGVLALLKDAIVVSRSNMDFINGLNIHYPHYGTEREAPPAPSEEYSAFMADMSAIRLGEPLTDWSTQQLTASREEGATIVTLPLTEEQAAHLDFARLFIFKQMKGNDYQLIYQSDDVMLREDHVLQATYEEQALFLVDAQGNVISQSIPYSLTEDGLVLNCMLTKEDALAEDFIILARAIFRKDDAGIYRLSELVEFTDDPTLQGKVSVNMADYRWLSVASNSWCPVYDENGRLLHIGHWTKGDYSYGWEIELADYPGWSVDFRSLQDNDSRVALLQMIDTQNNIACSELLPIDNPNVTVYDVERRLLVENDYARVWFTGVEMITGNYPQLRLLMECENRHTEAISIDLRNIQFDQTMMARGNGGSPAIDPGTTKEFRLDIDREVLERMDVQSIGQMAVDVKVMLNYFDEMTSDRVAIPLALDLRSLVPARAPRTVHAAAEWDGLEMTLYDLRAEGQLLTGVMGIRNTNAETVSFDEMQQLYINDVCIGDAALDVIADPVLPAGTTIHIEVEIDLTKDALMVSRPYLHGVMLEELGVTTLDTLGLIFCYEFFGEEHRVNFILDEPLALPLVNQNRSDNWHILYDKDGVRVQLMEIVWKADSDERALTLCFENTLEQTAQFYIPLTNLPEYGITIDCSVNGVALPYLFTPSEIAPGSVSYQRVSYYAKEDTADIREMVLTFTMLDDAGRNDRMQAVIVPLGEPKQAEGYCIYEAEQLQVSVTQIK